MWCDSGIQTLSYWEVINVIKCNCINYVFLTSPPLNKLRLCDDTIKLKNAVTGMLAN